MSRGAGSPRSSARSVLAALSVCGPAWWWVGSYQGCSEALHGLARGRRRRRRRRRSGGRWGCGACTRRWESTYNHTYIHARTTCTAPLGQRASSGGRGHTHARRHPFSTRCQESESPSISKNRRAIRPYSNSTLLLFRHYGGGVGAGRAAVRIGMGYGVAGARHHPRRACPSLGGRTLTFFTTARPPPAYVRTYAHGPERLLRRGSGRRAAAGAPRHRARGTRGGRPVSGERRAAGTVPAEPTMPQDLGAILRFSPKPF